MIWLLLFNCTLDHNNKIEDTNLVFQMENNYKTEAKCIKAAKAGIEITNNKGCYFVCVKGFRSN